ncbi:hypothetical protein DFH09DRAFT_1320065 [Mycena vulgaris]|nr:hypothetical protein DFH09DRAFT_1320065 [Mycena vulgaris]
MSPLTAALTPQSPTIDQPFLFNVFDMTPEQNNFIGISLSRTEDLEGSATASFTINELDVAYAAAADAPELPLFPGGNGRWSILVDSLDVDGVDIPLVSNVPNAPDRTLVAVMDTGAPVDYLPPDILYALYSQIPGASVRHWPFPIHPLDLSNVHSNIYDSGNNFTACIASLLSLTPGPKPDMDALLGDFFLRNVYSLCALSPISIHFLVLSLPLRLRFNFGNNVAKSPTGNATMQLLS